MTSSSLSIRRSAYAKGIDLRLRLQVSQLKLRKRCVFGSSRASSSEEDLKTKMWRWCDAEGGLRQRTDFNPASGIPALSPVNPTRRPLQPGSYFL